MDAVEEVRRLHDAIGAWFRGETDDLAPFADAMADEFRIVSPDGTTSDREAVIAGLRGARGAHAGETPPFRVEIRDPEVRASPGDCRLVAYEEHQRAGGEWTGRASTALLRPADDAPAGVEWVHVHETWLPD